MIQENQRKGYLMSCKIWKFVETFALKVQTNVRKKTLQQNGTNDLFAFSANRQPHAVDVLRANLLKLIQSEGLQMKDNTVEQALSYPSSLVGREIKHLWTDETGNIGGQEKSRKECSILMNF